MRLIVSQSAMADLGRLHAFLAEKNPVAASRVAATLIEAVQSLGFFPERGRPSGLRNVRELIVPFGRAGYVRRYAYLRQSNEVVLRIWHGRELRE
jgi:plasmid stabilization system protein ParE